MATRTKRKSNTAMVFNPSRGLSIGGRSTVRKSAAKRTNPVKRTATKTNPRRKRAIRRRNNPASVTGLVVTAVMAGIGVSLFDAIATRVVPQTSSLVRAGVKLGGAWLFQSQLGAKVPVLGKYKNDIALVLAVSGVVDLMKLYVLPVVSSAIGSVVPGAAGLLAAPAADDLGNIYGSANSPSNWNPLYN